MPAATLPDPAWDEPARLLRLPEQGRGWRGPRSGASEIMKGSLGALARHIREQDSDDLWRFVIVTADETYIRNADLRELIRREDIPAEA